jgi:hypothetical protein
VLPSRHGIIMALLGNSQIRRSFNFPF